VPYDDGLLERCLDALGALAAGPIRHKNVFGMRGLLRGDRMFAAVGEDGIIVRLAAAEFHAAVERRPVRPFTPGGTKLGTWVEIDADVIADDPDLREWLAAGLRSLG
jgi:TfoX/Sxy family transcriptional regulator of competence genes